MGYKWIGRGLAMTLFQTEIGIRTIPQLDAPASRVVMWL